MYKQTKATSKIRLSKGGSIVCPIATLKDEYGGVCHIAEDDHCYVLYQNNSDGTYSLATHIFKEAFEVLRNLPSPHNLSIYWKVLPVFGQLSISLPNANCHI